MEGIRVQRFRDLRMHRVAGFASRGARLVSAASRATKQLNGHDAAAAVGDTHKENVHGR